MIHNSFVVCHDCKYLLLKSRVGYYWGILNFPKKIFKKKPSYVFRHGDVESHSVWNENRSLWTPTTLTYVICVTWRQQVGASFVPSIVQTSYVFWVPMLCPEHVAYLPSSWCCLVLRHKGINWTECVHQFYAVFSNFSFSLHLCLSGIISVFLPFFSLLLKTF